MNKKSSIPDARQKDIVMGKMLYAAGIRLANYDFIGSIFDDVMARDGYDDPSVYYVHES